MWQARLPFYIKRFLNSKNTTAIDSLFFKIEGAVVCKLLTPGYRAVMNMEARLACIKQASHFNLHLEYFFEQFVCFGHKT
jgi:hypothetical protein